MNASFSDPRENVLQMGVVEGMRVADLGAGAGHYARAAAGVVGHEGRVYAIDVQEDVLKHIKNNAHDTHKGIIETVWGDIEKLGGTHLRDASIDLAILANTLFQVENREGLIAEIQRILKPGGTLAVIDWSGSFGGMGPSAENIVSETDAEAIFTHAGFTKKKSFPAGPHHYGVIFSIQSA